VSEDLSSVEARPGKGSSFRAGRETTGGAVRVPCDRETVRHGQICGSLRGANVRSSCGTLGKAERDTERGRKAKSEKARDRAPQKSRARSLWSAVWPGDSVVLVVQPQHHRALPSSLHSPLHVHASSLPHARACLWSHKRSIWKPTDPQLRVDLTSSIMDRPAMIPRSHRPLLRPIPSKLNALPLF